MCSRSTIRGRSHRTVDRDEGAELGRRPLLLLTFLALSARGAIFAVTSDPYLVVAAQLLDGVSAASLGVLVPLIIADVTRGSGHFNFAQGLIGAAVGIGASFSTRLPDMSPNVRGPDYFFVTCMRWRDGTGIRICSRARDARCVILVSATGGLAANNVRWVSGHCDKPARMMPIASSAYISSLRDS